MTDKKHFSIDFQTLSLFSSSVGLEPVGVSHTLAIDRESEKRLKEWQSAGMAGDMTYMSQPASNYLDVVRLLPEARSIVSFLVYYDRSEQPQRPVGYGRVARYAWGRDYHRVLKKRLKALLLLVSAHLGRTVSARGFTDAVPLLERKFAVDAGLGFQGKNSMIIRKKSGSYMFLCEVIWELEVELPDVKRDEGSCGSCTRCLTKCPTNAITRPYQIDATRCISYLTIEKKGVFTEWESKALDEWIFGCDICQEVCPFNHPALKEGDGDVGEFSKNSGAGPLLNLAEILRIRSDEEYLSRFAGTPLMRPKREGLLRNAACVAANTRALALRPALEEAFKNDSSEVVRHHAERALNSLELN